MVGDAGGPHRGERRRARSPEAARRLGRLRLPAARPGVQLSLPGPMEAEPFFARATELDPDLRAGPCLAGHRAGGRIPATTSARKHWTRRSPARGRRSALDDNDALCHHAMAYVALRRCEYDLAGHHHERAPPSIPNDPEIMAQRANWLMHVGRLDEALAALDASLERDPFPPTWVVGHPRLRALSPQTLQRGGPGVSQRARRALLDRGHARRRLRSGGSARGGAARACNDILRFGRARTLATVADKIIYADPGCATIGSKACAKPAYRSEVCLQAIFLVRLARVGDVQVRPRQMYASSALPRPPTRSAARSAFGQRQSLTLWPT